MKPPVLFDLFVRGVGLVFLYKTIDLLSWILGDFQDLSGPKDARMMLIRLVVFAGAAIWFLVGAPPVQDYVYPHSGNPEDNGSPSPESKMPTDKPISTYSGPPCVACGRPMPEGAKICPGCGWTQPT